MEGFAWQGFFRSNQWPQTTIRRDAVSYFRKRLWLIPFTLAKILLIFGVNWWQIFVFTTERDKKVAPEKNLG